MFDSLESRAVGYGSGEILKAAEAALQARMVAENELLVWTAAWADANPAESIHPDELAMIGGPRGVRPGGEGTPAVNDLSMLEFSAKIKKSEHAGMNFIGEVLDLRYRLPLLWGKVMRCEVEGWQARGIARYTHHLSLEQVRRVDDDLARYAGVVGWSKLQNLTEAAIVRVDGERMEREAAKRKAELGVWLSETNDAGLKGFFGQLEPPDAIRLFARVQEIADCLPPDSGTADERRAAALAMLGDEGQTAQLRVRHRQPDLFEEEFAAAVQVIAGEEDPEDPLEESEIHPSLRDQPTTRAIDVESAIFRAAVERIVQNLDPALLVPTSTLVVHIAAESLEDGHGVCRVPGIGPATMGVVKDWLGHHRVKVLPVIDLNDPPPSVLCRGFGYADCWAGAGLSAGWRLGVSA